MLKPNQKSPNRGTNSAGDGSDGGATLAEFAVVLPILLIVLFAIFEFGITFNKAQAIEAAAREGGRLASLSTTTAGDVQTRVDAALIGIVSGASVNVAPAPCAGRQGQTVTVTVSTPHSVTVPLVNTWAFTLTGQAIFRCEL